MTFGRKHVAFFHNSDGRVNIAEGSIRSGKTVIQVARWAGHIADAPPGELIMAGRTMHSLYRNVIAPIDTLPDLAWLQPHVKFRLGGSTGTFLGRTVHVLGANNEASALVLRGMTVAGALIDEVTTMPKSFFTELLGRMSPPGSKLFATTNPDSAAHWLRKDYLLRIPGIDPDTLRHTNPAASKALHNWTRWRFILDDNPNLDPEYKESIKSEYVGLWYDRFILGKWTNAEGAIYDMWSEREHVVPWDALPDIDQWLIVGVDQGTTNPSSGILLGLGVDRVLYMVDEWRVEPQEGEARLTDGELSASFQKWLAKQHHPRQRDVRPRYVAVDPAAASFMLQLHRDGVRGTTDADNDVSYGIRLVATALKQGWLKVSDRCTGWIKEAPNYRWDPKKTAEGQDVPIKVDDHSMDAGRYALTTSEPLWARLVARPGGYDDSMGGR